LNADAIAGFGVPALAVVVILRFSRAAMDVVLEEGFEGGSRGTDHCNVDLDGDIDPRHITEPCRE